MKNIRDPQIHHTQRGIGGHTHSNLQSDLARDPTRQALGNQIAPLAKSLRQLQSRIARKVQNHKPEEAQSLINRSARLYARLDDILTAMATLPEAVPGPPKEPHHKAKTRVEVKPKRFPVWSDH